MLNYQGVLWEEYKVCMCIYTYKSMYTFFVNMVILVVIVAFALYSVDKMVDQGFIPTNKPYLFSWKKKKMQLLSEMKSEHCFSSFQHQAFRPVSRKLLWASACGIDILGELRIWDASQVSDNHLAFVYGNCITANSFVFCSFTFLLKKTSDISVTPPLDQNLTHVIVSGSLQRTVLWQLEDFWPSSLLRLRLMKNNLSWSMRNCF